MGIFKPNVEKMVKKKDVKGLVRALEHENSNVRVIAAKVLGEIGDARAVEPLIKTLNDKEWDVRLSAEDALVRFREQSVEPLIKALKDGNSDVKGRAAKVLGRVGGWIHDARPAEPLIQALKDEDRSVRIIAAKALGELSDEKAVEPLIQTLGDRDIRAHAVQSLGEIGDNRAVEPLIEALNDEDANIRGLAAIALGRIQDERALKPLVEAVKEEGNPLVEMRMKKVLEDVWPDWRKHLSGDAA